MWNENIEESMKHATYKMKAFWVDLKLKRSLKYAKIAKESLEPHIKIQKVKKN